MKFQRKKKEKIDISMTSMIDVVFLLLIFFMVTTTFDRQTEVRIELPEAVGSEAESHPKTITMDIDADGTYYLKGEDGLSYQLVNQTRETLKQELGKLAEHSKQLPFVINTDGKTPSEAVLKVLDIAGQVGFSHITFSTLYPAAEK
ncbi:MAG: biopolymer transporter ExbD [Methylococcales bacterium]|nr:biopolymer transporter ExbD [Methylococcales bacterium]